MGKFGVGQAYRRTEDQRFLTGTARYTDDIQPDNVAYLHMLRSPYAHGEILELDTTAAAESPGVLAVYTIEDLDAAGIKKLPIGVTAPTAPGTQAADCPRPVLARGQVKYVGEPMVAIVAETQAQAEDAAELISFDIEDLPAVATLDAALREGGTGGLAPGPREYLFTHAPGQSGCDGTSVPAGHPCGVHRSD